MVDFLRDYPFIFSENYLFFSILYLIIFKMLFYYTCMYNNDLEYNNILNNIIKFSHSDIYFDFNDMKVYNGQFDNYNIIIIVTNMWKPNMVDFFDTKINSVSIHMPTSYTNLKSIPLKLFKNISNM
jgi:hypothetical protein